MIRECFDLLKPYWGSIGICGSLGLTVWKVLGALHTYFTNHLVHMAGDIKTEMQLQTDQIIIAIVEHRIPDKPTGK